MLRSSALGMYATPQVRKASNTNPAAKRSPVVAWRLFKFSNSYLALLYAAMVLDRLLALGGVALR